MSFDKEVTLTYYSISSMFVSKKMRRNIKIEIVEIAIIKKMRKKHSLEFHQKKS